MPASPQDAKECRDYWKTGCFWQGWCAYPPANAATDPPTEEAKAAEVACLADTNARCAYATYVDVTEACWHGFDSVPCDGTTFVEPAPCVGKVVMP